MYEFIKRLLDFLLSIIGLIILFPIFIIISICIKIDDPGKIFFKQKRVGKNLKPFYIYKFRSMKTNTPDCPTHLLKNPEQYITKVGKFLRTTSLDELPQILNILKGEMSIVGPRPCLFSQNDLIKERNKYGVNNIIPGLTGWAQINGRDELPIKVKAKFDGEYVKKRSLFFDVKIFFLTIFKVLKKEGIQEGSNS